MLEDNGTLGMLHVLFQAQPRSALTQDAGQGRLADLDRLPPKVRPVQLQQIEGVQKRLRLIPAVAEQVVRGFRRARKLMGTGLA
jgi:hypothetical protein